jgi:argininosuccinate lyase
MIMKLWDKGKNINEKIISFTSGTDSKLDLEIAGWDLIASIAHVSMICDAGLISKEDKIQLISSLLDIYSSVQEDEFVIEEGMEDMHSQVEKMLTEKLGEAGKKVHTARSRNDQILVDLKLFYRHQILEIVEGTKELIERFIKLSEENKEVLIPGYTHFQAAMPSSFGLWFGAYAESLTEDLMLLKGTFEYVNQNPLGSAAGYGSSFPINRETTTELLEFDSLHVNSVNAQMSRGKTEKFLLTGLGNIASTISRMAMDLVLYMSQNFDFVTLNEDLTTGSSIMPHKKNPDVLELIRAKCNRIQSLEFEVFAVTNNLPSGYHRDYQLLKEISFSALHEIKDCIEMMAFVSENLVFKKEAINNNIYKYISSVESINEKVKKGIPFREAYTQVADEIDKGRYRPGLNPGYTHTGSIGNLSNGLIQRKLESVLLNYKIEKYKTFEERFINNFKKTLS